MTRFFLSLRMVVAQVLIFGVVLLLNIYQLLCQSARHGEYSMYMKNFFLPVRISNHTRYY